MKMLKVIGNIGKDPEMKYTPDGKAVVNFSVAINEGKGDNKTTEWVKVVAWEKSAEILNDHAKAGSKIYLYGSCKIDVWLDKNTGDPRAQQVLTVREFEFLGDSKRKEESDEYPA